MDIFVERMLREVGNVDFEVNILDFLLLYKCKVDIIRLNKGWLFLRYKFIMEWICDIFKIRYNIDIYIELIFNL